jgi:hypothetical protein
VPEAKRYGEEEEEEEEEVVVVVAAEGETGSRPYERGRRSSHALQVPTCRIYQDGTKRLCRRGPKIEARLGPSNESESSRETRDMTCSPSLALLVRWKC